MNYTNGELSSPIFRTNDDACCEQVRKPPSQPVVETIGETSTIAEQILRQVRKINEFHFAEGPALVEETIQPKCFRDELVKTRNVLGTASEELERMANRLFPT